MKKIFCAIVFLLGLFGTANLELIELQAATISETKEYNFTTNLSYVYLREEAPWFKDTVDGMEYADNGKIYNIKSSNPNVAELHINNKELDIYNDPETMYYAGYFEIKNIGTCDITYDVLTECSEWGDGYVLEQNTYYRHYIIHVTITAKNAKSKSFQLMQGKGYYLENIGFPCNGTDKLHYSKKGIVKLSDSRIKAIKPGKVIINYVSFQDEYIKKGQVIVEIVPGKTSQKKALAVAKKVMAKQSAKATFAYMDLTGDGIKELVINGKMYEYNASKGKFESMTAARYQKLYYDKSKKRIMMVEKYDKNVGTVYTFYNKYIYYAKLSSAAKKKYKVSAPYGKLDFHPESGELLNIKGMSQSKFNAAVKKLVPHKKLVKFYKNTAKNRKAVLK